MSKTINGYELDEEENLKQMEEVDALATDLLNNVARIIHETSECCEKL